MTQESQTPRTETEPLPDALGNSAAILSVVLFSRRDCGFCNEVREHYLKPMRRLLPADVVIAEVEIDGSRSLRDWNGQALAHVAFARRHGVRFAPTVMFMDNRGTELAEAIVGLSRDFFGAYLDTRMAAARHAIKARVSRDGRNLIDTTDSMYAS